MFKDRLISFQIPLPNYQGNKMSDFNATINQKRIINLFSFFLFSGIAAILFSYVIIYYNQYVLEMSKMLYLKEILFFVEIFPFYQNLAHLITEKEYICNYMYILNALSILYSLFMSLVFSVFSLISSGCCDNYIKNVKNELKLFIAIIAISIFMIFFLFYDNRDCLIIYTGYAKRRLPFISSIFLFLSIYGALSFPALVLGLSKK